MRRSLHSLAPFALSSVLGCAGDPPPPVEAPVVTIAPLPPPAPPPPPPLPPALLVIPRAEASPESAPERRTAEYPALRSEGKHHALERTAYGIVILSDERGVLGFLPAPAPGAEIRWAGFVEGDAVLVATRDTLHLAATPDDAVAGKLQPLDKIDPAATHIASAGKLVVAAAPTIGGAYYESRDGGRHFAPAPPPTGGPVVDLAVRSDGVVVAAVETGVFQREGRAGVRAEARVSRRAGTWVRGPVIESFGTALGQGGDSIVVLSPRSGDLVDLGLDAGGRWIAASYPDTWPFSTSVGSEVEVEIPVARPGFPSPSKNDDGSVGGILGMLGGLGASCGGVECLGERRPAGGPPAVRAFHDGRCAKEHVLSHRETIHLMGFKGSKPQDVVNVERSCDPTAPADRAAALLVPAAGAPLTTRLALACAAGQVLGTERASFVYCSGKHRGRPALLHVTPAAALVEAAATMPPDLTWSGAESASDGTTLLFSDKGTWLCGGGPPTTCALVPREGFLAARPLPGGRALVARRGRTAAELRLDLLGEAGAQPLAVEVTGQVLDVQVTAEGNVRLWTSPTRHWMSSAASLATEKGALRLDAMLVRSDGELVPDTAAQDALLQAIEAARAAKPRR